MRAWDWTTETLSVLLLSFRLCLFFCKRQASMCEFEVYGLLSGLLWFYNTLAGTNGTEDIWGTQQAGEPWQKILKTKVEK